MLRKLIVYSLLVSIISKPIIFYEPMTDRCRINHEAHGAQLPQNLRTLAPVTSDGIRRWCVESPSRADKTPRAPSRASSSNSLSRRRRFISSKICMLRISTDGDLDRFSSHSAPCFPAFEQSKDGTPRHPCRRSSMDYQAQS